MLRTTIQVGIALSLLAVVPGWAQQESKDLFLDKCSVCHGAEGAGNTAKGRKLKVNDIHQTVGKMSEAEMTKVVADGKGKNMDGFSKELSPAQIKGVVEYYRSLGK